MWYQWAADVSPDFLRRYPEAKPNRFLPEYYGIPYRLVPKPKNVLILGAGTGNDVAAALRNGAEHIDAVELDPLILRLGKQYHPEHPYSSARVTAHTDDARAFLKKADKKYDLVIYGFLDSTTLLSGFSSLRLDNYVYTVEGFQNARALLSDNGTLVLSFATGRSFATDRLYATLERAFGTPPAAYLTHYWVGGVLMVEGGAREIKVPELPDVSQELHSRAGTVILATDAWPFLYLEGRSIPASILVVVPLFLLAAWKILQKSEAVSWKTNPTHWHFFFLGAGFLLLETKAITQLSLLYGSTWIVTSLVISSFLLMALLSNALVAVWSVSPHWCYFVLFILLIADRFFPYSLFNGVSFETKVLISGAWVAVPVFFSGLIFSGSLKNCGSASEALGINLFGAVCGGVLENAVMIGGTPVLTWLALVLYTLSAVSLVVSYRPKYNNVRLSVPA
jgi:SAM-dependent methyltransferase